MQEDAVINETVDLRDQVAMYVMLGLNNGHVVEGMAVITPDGNTLVENGMVTTPKDKYRADGIIVYRGSVLWQAVNKPK